MRKVSCILVSYNHGLFIRESLMAFFNQDTNDFDVEFIVSDDCSTDNTVQIIQEELSHLPLGKNIKFFAREKNLGLIKHLNTVIESATGDFIIVSAADDINFSNRIQVAVKSMIDNNVSLICSDGIIIDQYGNKKSRLFASTKSAPTLEKIFRSGLIGLPGAGFAFRKEIFTKFGPLPSNIENEDDQWPVRALLMHGIYVINEPLFYYRTHDSSLSAWSWSNSTTDELLIARYKLNLQNRLNHFKNWSVLIKFDSVKFNSVAESVINKRINLYSQMLQSETFVDRLLLFKFCKIATFREFLFIFFSFKSCLLNRKIERLKLVIKKIIYKKI
ncbi:glycosyltransferase [Shewanella xiamenensis]|uniref:Glycosyltransferase n=1 Tax=Shewanella xiamenensis TaxID=332186 RepID=A0ABT6U9U0_9GAMM|nr:glycosyltransferase [Shewanella xiamenensis]MDI5831234.1 glycosyltransferase [Shewanella xiamenensis]UML95037.1 glycosyltransferase [Shewanella xiamenensis]